MIVAGAAATTLGGYALWAIGRAGTASVGGYGIDPSLFSPTVTWGKSLAREQIVALRILSDIVIPADEYSPKASDLDIPDFINEWVSAPYPEQQTDRKTLLNGLQYLDRQAG